MPILITSVISFMVPDDTTNEEIYSIVGSMQAQVDGEGLVGLDDDGNEQTVPTRGLEVSVDIERDYDAEVTF